LSLSCRKDSSSVAFTAGETEVANWISEIFAVAIWFFFLAHRVAFFLCYEVELKATLNLPRAQREGTTQFPFCAESMIYDNF